jgi:hypothetical protein
VSPDLAPVETTIAVQPGIPAPDRTATTLRRGLLGLAGAGVLGTAVELAITRHWEAPAQIIPWVALGCVTAAILGLVTSPNRSTVTTGRWTGLLLAATGLYGVIDHVATNVSAGPLDAQYGARWDSMTTVAHWWAAANGGVGPAPTLAPAVLAQIGLCLALATLGHPVLQRSRPSSRQAQALTTPGPRTGR